MKYLILLSYLLSTLPVHATLNDVDKAFLVTENVLVNPGFENGKASWSASGGTFTTVTTGTNLLAGKVSATWDSSGAAQSWRSAAVAIPKGLYGRNGVASCVIQTPSGTATHTIGAYDGAASLVASSITSSATPARSTANFIFPSSGNIQLEILSVAADEPLIAVDSCYLGSADGFNVGQYAAATFVGESYFAGTTNCTGWTRTSATLGRVATDADCPGPTILSSNLGSWQTTDTDLPLQTINNLPPGTYKATFIVPFAMNTAAGAALAIHDGSTTCTAVQANNFTTTVGQVVSCYFTYTTAGNRACER
jgi:hypothetical protein